LSSFYIIILGYNPPTMKMKEVGMNKKFLSILVVLTMVVSLVAPLGNKVKGAYL